LLNLIETDFRGNPHCVLKKLEFNTFGKSCLAGNIYQEARCFRLVAEAAGETHKSVIGQKKRQAPAPEGSVAFQSAMYRDAHRA
jgi:hypothetical protein